MFAPGIPEKNYFGTIPAARETQWDLSIQLHEADRAGRHYDIRLSPPGVTEAYSWACKEIPGPGAKTTAVEQPTHTRDYMSFSGTIEKGYGAGKVSLYYSGKVIILSASGTEIKFVLEKNSGPERFLLKKGLDKDWLFYNYTPTVNSKIYADLPSKPTKIRNGTAEIYKHNNNNSEVWSPNLAGTENIIVLRDGKRPDIFSWTSSRRSEKKIDNSFKVSLGPMPSFTDHGKTILRGKLFYPGMELNKSKKFGNSKAPNVFYQTPNSQQIALFDVYKFKGQKVDHLPYQDKFKILQSISNNYPGLKTIPLAKSPQEKAELLESISEGRNPLTTRGIISYNLKESKPFKFEIKDMSKEHLVKTALVGLTGAAMGFFKADELTGKEKKKLHEYHYISPGSSLTARNMGRGFLGGLAGGVGGAMAGSIGGAMVGAISGNPRMAATGASLGLLTGFLGGGLGGAHLATNKYSRNSPILKEASISLLKKANLGTAATLGGAGAVGAFRTSRLTDDEKAKIKQKAGLKEDANLSVRNTGRGVAGAVLGALTLGSVPAFGAGVLAAAGKIKLTKGLMYGLSASSVAGAAVGTKLMTDKYSKKSKYLKD